MTQVGWGTFYEMGKGVPVRQSDCQTVRQTPAAHSSRGKDFPKRVFTLDGELLQDLGLKSMFLLSTHSPFWAWLYFRWLSLTLKDMMT